jgi:hypothetical protein
MHQSRAQTALMTIPIFSAHKTIASTNVSMFEALSAINAIAYTESSEDGLP